MRIWNPFRRKAPVTAGTPVRPKRDWQLYAIISAAPAIVALLVWQLGTLTPQEWCGVAVGASKAAHAIGGPALRPEDCGSILLKLLDIKNTTIIGLLIALVVSYLLLVVDRIGAGLHIQGPNGLGLDIKGNGADAENNAPIAVMPVQQVVVQTSPEAAPAPAPADTGTAPASE